MDTPRHVHTFLRALLAALVCLLALAATASAYRGGSVESGYAGSTAGSDTSTSGTHETSVRLPAIEERRAVADHNAHARKAKHHRKHHRLRHHQMPTPVATDRGKGGGSTGPTGSAGSPGSTGSTSSSGAHKGGSTGGGGTITPPVKTHPKETPPKETPTVETPPVEPPPAAETPPVEAAPPVGTPPAGSQTSNCFATPSACGFPDPTNTGVPAGVTLTPSGSLTVTQAGAVISGKQVTGTINVLANNVTIENTKIIQNTTCGPTSTCGNYAIRIDEGAGGTTIRNVETSSIAGDTCEHDIRNTGGTTTIENSYLHACDSNVYAVGPTTLKNSYGIAKIAISDDHIENIYFNETSFTAIHDTLLNPVEQTAVIFGNSGGGTDVTNCSNHLTITESLLGGGGYTLYPCAHAAQAGSSSFDIERNHFARCVSAETYVPNGGTHPCVAGADTSGYYPKSGSYGLAANYFPTAGIWRGNVWDNNLTKVCIDARSTGCE
jgi:hypothetical protein